MGYKLHDLIGGYKIGAIDVNQTIELVQYLQRDREREREILYTIYRHDI